MGVRCYYIALSLVIAGFGREFSSLKSRIQLVHPFQKDLAASLALFVLVLGFGESDLIHGGNESYAVGSGRLSGATTF